MKQWLERFLKAIVKHPDEVVVSQTEGVRTVVYQVRVAPVDYGRVKGRRGRMINALKTVAALCGRKVRVRHVVELVEQPQVDEAAAAEAS